MEQPDKKNLLNKELYDYFIGEGFTMISAAGIDGCKFPQPLPNDGYGDQEDKRPDIFAFDPASKCRVIGITRTDLDDLTSEESLTEYNVFLDQKDPVTQLGYRLYVNLPASLITEFNALIREYIHREYWHRIVVMQSTKFIT